MSETVHTFIITAGNLLVTVGICIAFGKFGWCQLIAGAVFGIGVSTIAVAVHL